VMFLKSSVLRVMRGTWRWRAVAAMMASGSLIVCWWRSWIQCWTIGSVKESSSTCCKRSVTVFGTGFVFPDQPRISMREMTEIDACSRKALMIKFRAEEVADHLINRSVRCCQRHKTWVIYPILGTNPTRASF
jgi:hypothetical protein